jgi:hypothetical protein
LALCHQCQDSLVHHDFCDFAGRNRQFEALNTRIGNQLRGSVRASSDISSAPFSAASHPRRIRRQRFPNIRLGDSELSSNLRWLDPCLERSANSIQLS